MAGTGAVEHRRDGQSPYLSSQEAAALLHLSRRTVQKWAADGRLQRRMLGTALRVTRRSVERYLPAAEVETPEPEPPALDRVLALLPELSSDERRRVALAALQEGAA